MAAAPHSRFCKKVVSEQIGAANDRQPRIVSQLFNDFVFDIFGVAMIATLFFARINCLIAGCCKGLSIHGLEPARWPTREAELVFYVVFLAIMAPKVFKDKTKGLLYPIYMIAYGVFRFAIEFFRESGGGRAWHIAHLWAFLAAAIGISVAAEMWAIKKRRANPQ